MYADLSYHYPADLLQLLVETIPLLCRSKMDTVTFFRGAGVPVSMLDPIERTVQTNRESINKYAIARTVLTQVSEGRDATLRERREIVRRVVEFENFNMCWETDRDSARARVADISKMVSHRDAFTRMNLEREAERRKAAELADLRAKEKRERAEENEAIKRAFYPLFSMSNARARGIEIEKVFTRLFKAHGIHIRDPFTVTFEELGGVTAEQIDGAIEIDGHIYLVEIKWWSKPLDIGDVAKFMVRLFSRQDVRGFFIANPGYTAPCIHDVQGALSHKTLILAELEEFVRVLDAGIDVREYLRRKVHAAVTEKQPLFKPSL